MKFITISDKSVGNLYIVRLFTAKLKLSLSLSVLLQAALYTVHVEGQIWPAGKRHTVSNEVVSLELMKRCGLL